MEVFEQLSSLSPEDETQIHETLIVQNKEKTMEAKPKQHHQWKSEKVYEEVPNQGQNCISQIGNKREISSNLSKQDYVLEVLKRNKTSEQAVQRVTEGLRLTCSMIA